ncbi:molybdopterin-synthase adenylyltransferase MoeB [Nonlabens sp. Asnod2-A12]|uniref:molybdopterin-synthase adenylyltransferase MoeB n=1 Tax=Nonlabens sp. Asnod2-A12 TaxID=3160578 RepID=UPI00386992EF
MSLTREERKQYDRHILLDEIGEKGQLKLKKARVLVIGAGGLGCAILQYLTAAGVGTIGVIDDDVIEQSNLQRQILYTIDDVGKSKALTAIKRLSRLNPFINFHLFQEKLNSKNAIELFNDYDIIVDGSDNFPTRYLANDAAVITNKPLVYGAIFKFEGQVSVFNYKGSATYRCLYPTSPDPKDSPNCSEIGVLGVLPGIIGSLQANEVIKMVCGIGNVLSNQLLTYNMLTMQQMVLTYKKNTSIEINELNPDYNYACGIKVDDYGITKNQLKALHENYDLLDVRELHERELHHIGGHHIPLSELEKRSSEITTDRDLVVYCKSGIRSKKAVQILKQIGFKNTLFYLNDSIF